MSIRALSSPNKIPYLLVCCDITQPAFVDSIGVIVWFRVICNSFRNSACNPALTHLYVLQPHLSVDIFVETLSDLFMKIFGKEDT